MTLKRVIAAGVFAAVVGGTFTLSKTNDLTLLLNAGRAAKKHIVDGLPSAHRLTAPVTAFRPGDALPIEERVRVRILTDQSMTGADVTVHRQSDTKVQLVGVVQSSGQKQRAVELANTTRGVTIVVDELAIPVGK